MATRDRKRFSYQERNAESVKKRADQSGSSRDFYIPDEYKVWQPKAGDHTIRILPPTWDEAEHHGFDIYVHYGVGPDDAQYLCLAKMKGEHCPICEERKRLEAEGDQEAADALKPSKRVLVWMIDRNEEKEGPMIWSMPWTIDRDISKLVVDKRSGEVLPIDHPEEGYDIEFERKGTGMKTEYLGLQIARRSSDLGEEKWLDYVVDHPLPEVLKFYEEAYIKAVFAGASKSDDDEEPPKKAKEETSSRRRLQNDDEDEQPARSSRKPLDAEEEPARTPRERARRLRDDD